MSHLGHNTKEELKSIIDRIETAEVEKADIAEHIKEIYAESKGRGYDVKALKTIIKLRKIDPAKREEEETILQTYMSSLGMLPLFEHADAE